MVQQARSTQGSASVAATAAAMVTVPSNRPLTLRRNRRQSALTLIEVLISAIILAGFFGSIFELSTACLHYIDASKESVAALEAVQDRTEALRNLAFSDLT